MSCTNQQTIDPSTVPSFNAPPPEYSTQQTIDPSTAPSFNAAPPPEYSTLEQSNQQPLITQQPYTVCF